MQYQLMIAVDIFHYHFLKYIEEREMWILTVLIELDIRVWYIETLHWQLKKEKYLPKHKTYETENHEWDESEERFYSQFSPGILSDCRFFFAKYGLEFYSQNSPT